MCVVYRTLWQIESTDSFQPDIKDLQIKLTGFLDKDTAKFCKELWSLCLSAQSNPQGVPKELLEAKKLELIQEKVRRSCRLRRHCSDPVCRSMLRNPPKQRKRGKRRKDSATGT